MPILCPLRYEWNLWSGNSNAAPIAQCKGGLATPLLSALVAVVAFGAVMVMFPDARFIPAHRPGLTTPVLGAVCTAVASLSAIALSVWTTCTKEREARSLQKLYRNATDFRFVLFPNIVSKNVSWLLLVKWSCPFQSSEYVRRLDWVGLG